MWLLIAREPHPDARCWPGRRLLAVIDALAWPMMVAIGCAHLPLQTGLAGPFIVAMAALVALRRLHRAVWVNHRYWFTTWRWGRIVGALLIVGAVLKQLISA